MKKLLPLLLLIVFVNAYGYVVTSLPYNITANGVYWINTSLYCNYTYCFNVTNTSVTNITIISNGSGKIYLYPKLINTSTYAYSPTNNTWFLAISYNASYPRYLILYNKTPNNTTIKISNLEIIINNTTINSTISLGNHNTSIVYSTPSFYPYSTDNVYLNNIKINNLLNKTYYFNIIFEYFTYFEPHDGIYNRINVYNLSDNGNITLLLYSRNVNLSDIKMYNNSSLYAKSVHIFNDSYFSNSSVYLNFTNLVLYKILNPNQSYANISLTRKYGMFNVSVINGYITSLFSYNVLIEVVNNSSYITYNTPTNPYFPNVTFNIKLNISNNTKFYYIEYCNLTNASLYIYAPTLIKNVNAMLQYTKTPGSDIYGLINNQNIINLSNYKNNTTIEGNSIKVGFTLINFSIISPTPLVTKTVYGLYSTINNSWMPINLSNTTVYVSANFTTGFFDTNNSTLLFGRSVNSNIIINNDSNSTYGIVLYINLSNKSNTTIYINNSKIFESKIVNQKIYSYNSSFYSFYFNGTLYCDKCTIRRLMGTKAFINNSNISNSNIYLSPSLNVTDLNIYNSGISFDIGGWNTFTTNNFTGIVSDILNMSNSIINVNVFTGYTNGTFNVTLIKQPGSILNIKNTNFTISLYVEPYNNTTLNLVIGEVNNSTISIENTTIFNRITYIVYNNTTNVTVAYNETKLNLYGFNISNSKLYVLGFNSNRQAFINGNGVVNLSLYLQYLPFLDNLNKLKYLLNLVNTTANISCSYLCGANQSVIGNSKYYMWYSYYLNIDPSLVINWPDGNKQCPYTLLYGQKVYGWFISPFVCPFFIHSVVNVTTNTTKKKVKKSVNIFYTHRSINIAVPEDISKVGVGFDFKLLLLFLIFFIAIMLLTLGYLSERK